MSSVVGSGPAEAGGEAEAEPELEPVTGRLIALEALEALEGQGRLRSVGGVGEGM